MMHFEEVVVTLVDNANKPLREFGSQRIGRGRKCEVFAQAESEYKFLVKNNTDRRIKVSIDIDGTNVAGNGLILNAHASEYIERFVDVDKKFKTSRLTGEGVADPTSPENGIIKVRVHKEKVADPIPSLTKIIEEHHHHHTYWDYPWYNPNRPMYYTANVSSVLRGCADTNIGGAAGDNAVYGALNVSPSVATPGDGLVKSVNCSYSVPMPQPAEALATVEGAKSDQVFGSTTWLGDDLAFAEVVFTFFLKLAQQVVDPEYAEYMRLKEKFGK